MALVKLTALLSDLSGKLNGTIFSRNHWGLYSKAWFYPVNTITPLRIKYRTAFKEVSEKWKTLSNEERLSWIVFASTVTKSNTFGDTYNPSGFSLFCSCNINLLLIGESIINIACWEKDIISLTIFDVNITMSPSFNITLDFSGITTDTNTIHLIYATPEQHPSVNYVKAAWRLIGIIPALTSENIDITSDYLSIFPTPAGSQKIFVKLKAINKNSGLASMIVKNSGLT